MGDAAREHIIDNYSTNHIVNRYEALFREIVA